MKPPWLAELGNEIRNARRAKRMRQEDLAAKADLTRQMISHYENAKYVPTVDVVTNIVTALGTPLFVRGCRIGLDGAKVIPLQAEPSQLCLDFGKDHTFKAKVIIRAEKKEIIIRTTAGLPPIRSA